MIFSFRGLKELMYAPFNVGTDECKTVWGAFKDIKIKDRLKLLQLNWVAMVGLGALASASARYLVS